MGRNSEENANSRDSRRIDLGSMALFVLSIACFVVFLWVLTVAVRLVVGLGA